MSHHILQLEGDCMEQEDRDDWIKRLEARRDEEIQQMFAENSDSECIAYEDYQQLPHKFWIDRDTCMLIDLLRNKRDAKRKREQRKKKKANEAHR